MRNFGTLLGLEGLAPAAGDRGAEPVFRSGAGGGGGGGGAAAAEEDETELLFVYGSLLTELHNHRHMGEAMLLGVARTVGEEYTMVSAGSYPFSMAPGVGPPGCSGTRRL